MVGEMFFALPHCGTTWSKPETSSTNLPVISSLVSHPRHHSGATLGGLRVTQLWQASLSTFICHCCSTSGLRHTTGSKKPVSRGFQSCHMIFCLAPPPWPDLRRRALLGDPWSTGHCLHHHILPKVPSSRRLHWRRSNRFRAAPQHCTVQRTQFSVQCAVCGVQCAVCSAQCVVRGVQCAVERRRRSIFSPGQGAVAATREERRAGKQGLVQGGIRNMCSALGLGFIVGNNFTGNYWGLRIPNFWVAMFKLNLKKSLLFRI